jgi:hypothetical protein
LSASLAPLLEQQRRRAEMGEVEVELGGLSAAASPPLASVDDLAAKTRSRSPIQT